MKKSSADNKFFSFDALIEVCLLVIVFLVPTIFDRRLGIVFSGAKIAWLRVFVVVTMSAWAIKLLVRREHRFFRTVLDWPIAAYLLTTTVAALTSVQVYISLTGFYGRFEGLTTWYIFGLLFLLVTNFVHNSAQIKRLFTAVVSSATLMSVYGVIQRQEIDPYMWGGVITWQRVIGTIGQPNFLAAYVLMAFFLGLVLLLEEKQFPKKIDWTGQLAPLGYFFFSQVTFIVMLYTLDAQDVLVWYLGWGLVTAGAVLFAFNYDKLHPLVQDVLWVICLAAMFICLNFTQSRGGYMGFGTGAVLFALAAGRHWLFKNWRELALLGVVIVSITAFTMLRTEYSPIERFAGEISAKEEISASGVSSSQLELKGAAGSRGETWKSAFGIMADNPLFGVGPEVLKMVFPRYETDLFRFKETFHVKQDRCHNETCDVPVTKGLISFALYFWIIALVFRTGWSKLRGASDNQRLMLAGLMAGSLAYLIQNQFSFGVVAITSLFWMMMGVVMVVGREEASPEPRQKLNVDEIPWLWVSLVALAGVGLVYCSFFSFRSDIYFKAGKTMLDMRALPQAAEELKKALAIQPFEGTTVSHLGIANLNMGNTIEAARYLEYGTKIDPYNADNFYMLARLCLALGERNGPVYFQRAWQNNEIALKIDPYYAEAYETRGFLLERQGKPAAALVQYEKAFSVNPTLPGPIMKVEELNRRLGRLDNARRIFGEMNRRFPDNIEVFKALERVK
ncbi:MAG: O-antigen ligase family protein [Candidatus Margulisiibacteriota bacterium]